jgi:hypothetical protein
MATDNHTATPGELIPEKKFEAKLAQAAPESETESFVELMHRFMSAKHRLRVAVNDFADFSCEHHEPAWFVMQEAMDDLEKVLKDFRAWEDAHEHTPKAPKEVQS